MTERVETQGEEHVVYAFFFWSVLLKLLISVIEVVSGISALFIPPLAVVQVATMILNHLPIPQLQNVLLQEVAAYTGGTVAFVAFYLLSRGLIKVFLLVGVLKNLLWTYPASLAVLGGLVLYQCYQLYTSGSLIITFITLFDLVVMYFVYREWRIVLRHNGVRSA